MTIAQINNIFLLLFCGCLAYGLLLLFQAIYEISTDRIKSIFYKPKQKAKVIPLRRGYVKQLKVVKNV